MYYKFVADHFLPLDLRRLRFLVLFDVRGVLRVFVRVLFFLRRRPPNLLYGGVGCFWIPRLISAEGIPMRGGAHE